VNVSSFESADIEGEESPLVLLLANPIKKLAVFGESQVAGRDFTQGLNRLSIWRDQVPPALVFECQPCAGRGPIRQGARAVVAKNYRFFAATDFDEGQRRTCEFGETATIR